MYGYDMAVYGIRMVCIVERSSDGMMDGWSINLSALAWLITLPTTSAQKSTTATTTATATTVAATATSGISTS